MDRSEPTLLSAAWKHRTLFVIVVTFSILVGLAFATLSGESTQYIAESLMVLQDPDALDGGGTSDQFVSEQVQIIRSPIVTEAAVEALESESVDQVPTAEELMQALRVFSSENSSLVFLSIEAEDPENAVAFVNSIAMAYRNVSRLQGTQSTVAALARIDAQLESLQERFSEVSREIRVQRDADSDLRRLEQQFREALAELDDLQAALLEADEDESGSIRQRISDLRSRIDTYRQASATVGTGPELQALIDEQDQLINRRTELLQRRDQISIDAELAPEVVALVNPAEEASEFVDSGIQRTLAVAIVVGVLAALGLAYFLELRRRTFGGRLEPEPVLGAPLLADIPLFSEENLGTQLPVRDYPRSAAAESFRFAAASIEDAMRVRGAKSVMMVGATLGHGKSTCLVNTGMANARRGHSVLLIDGDFGNQDTTRLLVDSPPTLGLVDVVEVGLSVDRAVVDVPLENDVSISLLSRGRRPTIAANLLSSKGSGEVFDRLSGGYDLILVDAPPVLQVAYASTLANYVDGLVVVISHGTPVRELEELVNRMKLIDTPVLGYLYNRSPLRKEMTAVDGSLLDILGEEGNYSEKAPASWWQRVGNWAE